MKHSGLTDAEVLKSREEHGSNILTEHKQETFLHKLIENLKDPMIIILLVALAINVIFWLCGFSEWYETVGIFLAIILATFVSTFSEFRNESAFQKLQNEASKILCKAFRNNSVSEISIDDVVKGDLIKLQSGDKIPADGYIVEGLIRVDQSTLNGESKEATKSQVPDDFIDQENEHLETLDEYHVFRGTIVCSGDAVMLVTKVGDKSEYGKIAKELQTTQDRDTPLKVKLSNLAKLISKCGYTGGVLIAFSYIIHCMCIAPDLGAYVSSFVFVTDILKAIMFAVVIIVMAVPEGLPLMIAIVSALNMKKMLKDNVLVRKIAGIETAGSLNLLFSDKTGTITKGKLEVVSYLVGDGNSTFASYQEIPSSLRKLTAASIFLNTQCVISSNELNPTVVGGNITDHALCNYALLDHKSDFASTAVANVPFNSTNKFSATTVTGSYNLTFIKGAPEKLLQKCNGYYDINGNRVENSDFSALNAQIDNLATRAIRVLALATTTATPDEDGNLPDGEWTLIGCVGIRDEVRPEARDAIKEVKNAGIQVVMITGDRKETAYSIAKDSGLISSDPDSKEIVWTSEELSKHSDEEVKAVIKDLRVVARALPSDKSRLVRLAQELDLVVGMTGDGVNDSPALKKSDISFAMGSGTEVAKEASDIVILDDNFLSIEKAILYGRTIFNSIRKFIIFQLTVNVAAVIISFIMPLLGGEMPLTITQILWVNLVMDTLAALALGGEPPLKRFMAEKPKSRRQPLVNTYMGTAIFLGAIWLFTLGMILLFNGSLQSLLVGFDSEYQALLASGADVTKLHSEIILTSFFTLFIFTTIFNAFNSRTDSLNLFEHIHKNKGFLSIIGLITIIQILMTQSGMIWPTFGKIMNCHGLTIEQWGVIILMALTIIPIDLLRKLIVKKLGIKA
jgi:calcium-translocating P-type ATPase